MVRCPNCGVELKETNWGNYLCPNCGKFEKEDIEKTESDSDETPKYIG